MSTHNIYFHGEIRKNINRFWLKKSALSVAINKDKYIYITLLLFSKPANVCMYFRMTQKYNTHTPARALSVISLPL